MVSRNRRNQLGKICKSACDSKHVRGNQKLRTKYNEGHISENSLEIGKVYIIYDEGGGSLGPAVAGANGKFGLVNNEERVELYELFKIHGKNILTIPTKEYVETGLAIEIKKNTDSRICNYFIK